MAMFRDCVRATRALSETTDLGAMKIVIVHNSYLQPGGEEVVVDLERNLLERAGHEVTVYHRSNFEVECSSIVRLPARAVSTIWSWDTRRDFARILSREKPHLVHIHNIFVMVSPSIYYACREAQIPIVQTLHNYRLFCPASNFFRDGEVCEDCIDHSLWRSVQHGCYHGSRAASAFVALSLAVHHR